MNAAPERHSPPSIRVAWLGLATALAVHVADEAAHDFLSVYNPTVRRIREAVPFLPLPTFTFAGWLVGLVVATLALLLLGWRAGAGARWVRPLGYAFAVLMGANGLLHLTVSAIERRLMPGTLSAPLLLLGSAHLFWAVRGERVSNRGHR